VIIYRGGSCNSPISPSFLCSPDKIDDVILIQVILHQHTRGDSWCPLERGIIGKRHLCGGVLRGRIDGAWQDQVHSLVGSFVDHFGFVDIIGRWIHELKAWHGCSFSVLAWMLFAFFLPRGTDELSPSLPFIDWVDETMTFSNFEVDRRPDLSLAYALLVLCMQCMQLGNVNCPTVLLIVAYTTMIPSFYVLVGPILGFQSRVDYFHHEFVGQGILQTKSTRSTYV